MTIRPLSNHRLKIIPSLSDCPVATALEAGLPVTVSPDDPSYFGGYLVENHTAIAEAPELQDDQLIALIKNLFVGSFLRDSDKQKPLDIVDKAVS
tara:strand:+ start:313 stop:597 length:285 start_codon:yes stop_codon:yes gene_type:complete